MTKIGQRWKLRPYTPLASGGFHPQTPNALWWLGALPPDPRHTPPLIENSYTHATVVLPVAFYSLQQ